MLEDLGIDVLLHTTIQRFNDVVAIGAWGFEWHDSTKEDWSSIFTLPPKGCFEIPPGCLWSVDTANLWAAGRCADGDQKAGSAIRVMELLWLLDKRLELLLYFLHNTTKNQRRSIYSCS